MTRKEVSDEYSDQDWRGPRGERPHLEPLAERAQEDPRPSPRVLELGILRPNCS